MLRGSTAGPHSAGSITGVRAGYGSTVGVRADEPVLLAGRTGSDDKQLNWREL